MANRRSAIPEDAQRGYKFSGALPAKRRGKAQDTTSDTLAKLAALAQAGLLNDLLPKRRGARRGVDLAQLMALYAKYKPIIDILLPLVEKYFKRDDKPVEDSGGDGGGNLPPGADDDEDAPTPPPSPARTPKKLEAKVFWVSRKHQPGKVGGGRYLLSDAAKAKAGKDDPLQRGDRVCFDVSPYDQNGRKYEGEKPLELEHVVGGVGELQTQEDNDHTPVVLVPNVGDEVVPGFQGEITYQAKGGDLKSSEIRLRVRPWQE